MQLAKQPTFFVVARLPFPRLLLRAKLPTSSDGTGAAFPYEKQPARVRDSSFGLSLADYDVPHHDKTPKERL